MVDFSFWDYAILYGGMTIWMAVFGFLAIAMFLNENPFWFFFAGGAFVAFVFPGLMEESAKKLMEDTAFMEAIDDNTPRRSAKPHGISYFGADAATAMVIGRSEQDRRIHCVTYFDGRQEAFYTRGSLSRELGAWPIDLEICKRAGVFSNS